MGTSALKPLRESNGGWGVSDDKSMAERLEWIRQETGKDVKAIDPRWLRYMKEGVIVNIHIRRWRGRTSLSPQDLGLDPEQASNIREIADLGEKLLMPREYLNKLSALDRRARGTGGALERHTFRTAWGFFCPVTAYGTLREKLDEISREYFAVRDEILRGYYGWVEEVKTRYRQAAAEAYNRLLAVAPQTLDGQSQDEFVTGFVTRILDKIPTTDEIRESFAFEVELSYIPLPSMLAEEQARAQGIRVATDVDVERLQAQREQERLVEEVEKARLWAQREEAEATAWANRTAAQAKKAALEAMNRDVLDRAQREAGSMVDGFLRDVGSQLNNLVFDACRDVLKALQEKQTLHSRSVVQLKTMIEQVSSLNFTGDESVAGMVEKVRREILAQQASNRNTGSLERVLGELVIESRSALLNLGTEPASVRSLGLPDMERQERRGKGRSLGLEPLPALELERDRVRVLERA